MTLHLLSQSGFFSSADPRGEHVWRHCPPCVCRPRSAPDPRGGHVWRHYPVVRGTEMRIFDVRM